MNTPDTAPTGRGFDEYEPDDHEQHRAFGERLIQRRRMARKFLPHAGAQRIDRTNRIGVARIDHAECRVGHAPRQFGIRKIAEPAEAEPGGTNGTTKSQTCKNVRFVARANHASATVTPRKPPWNDMPPSQMRNSHSGSCEELFEPVKKDVADAAAEHRTERAVEHDVGDLLRASSRCACCARGGCRATTPVTNPARYARPYQRIAIGPRPMMTGSMWG